MLLLLLLAHTLSSGRALESRAPADSCDDTNNCRRLFDIIWGCLTTLFACTWVSVHPNVPPPNQGAFALLWRRLKMMLIAVIAPELMVGFAARQLWAARRFLKEFEKHGVSITLTHGFFISMGGFVSRSGHPITTIKQLTKPEYLSAIQQIEMEEIRDKSKGDALSKGVALIQGLWFITQCLARVHQRLAVTELEIATLAFAVVNIFIWSLWWAKPLDVQHQISIGPAREMQHGVPTIPHLSQWDRLFGALKGDYSPYVPIAASSVPAFWSMYWEEAYPRDFRPPFVIEVLMGAIFGAIHCTAWNASFTSSLEIWMWRTSSLLVAAIPAVLGVFFAIYALSATGGPIERILDPISGTIIMVAVVLYPVARLFLIVIAFTTLRALPQSAFVDVAWSIYIPHL
ncbi:hypothetical protein B0H13DRAFT_2523468 [Mycena leptocephala]|nr:hypothetical protein B0H13DRAFT_2523468 [Mycena leptocephala]